MVMTLFGLGPFPFAWLWRGDGEGKAEGGGEWVFGARLSIRLSAMPPHSAGTKTDPMVTVSPFIKLGLCTSVWDNFRANYLTTNSEIWPRAGFMDDSVYYSTYTIYWDILAPEVCQMWFSVFMSRLLVFFSCHSTLDGKWWDFGWEIGKWQFSLFLDYQVISRWMALHSLQISAMAL